MTVNWVTPRPQLEGQYTQSATICKGDIVTFTWATALPHNLGKATSGFYSRCAGRGWSRISPDVTSYRKSIKFNTVGTSYYVCSYSNHCKIGKTIMTALACGNSPFLQV